MPWRPHFPSRFIGEGNQPQQLRAILDSIVFLLQRNMVAMDAAGLRADKLVISGGLANSDGFCQTLSDLSGKDVERTTNTEATARGTAFLLAGMPEGWQVGARQVFVPRTNALLVARYQAWQKVMADSTPL